MKVSNLYISQVKRKCGIEAEQICNELGLDEEEKQLTKRGAYAMPGILVVEDDENLNRGITFSLILLKKPHIRIFSVKM